MNNIVSNDEYEDICERADYWGMESLTEEEQIIVNCSNNGDEM